MRSNEEPKCRAWFSPQSSWIRTGLNSPTVGEKSKYRRFSRFLSIYSLLLLAALFAFLQEHLSRVSCFTLWPLRWEEKKRTKRRNEIFRRRKKEKRLVAILEGFFQFPEISWYFVPDCGRISLSFSLSHTHTQTMFDFTGSEKEKQDKIEKKTCRFCLGFCDRTCLVGRGFLCAAHTCRDSIFFDFVVSICNQLKRHAYEKLF